jgi:hypothetical protein
MADLNGWTVDQDQAEQPKANPSQGGWTVDPEPAQAPAVQATHDGWTVDAEPAPALEAKPDNSGYIPEQGHEEPGMIGKAIGAVVSPLVKALPEEWTNPKDQKEYLKDKGEFSPKENHSWIQSQGITDKDINYLAQRHKVDPEMLKSRVGWYGGAYTPKEGDSQSSTEGVKSGLANTIGEGILGGIPRWLEKKSHDKLNERMALDDLNKLVQARNSKAETAIQLGTGLANVGKTLGLAEEGMSAGAKAAKLAESTPAAIAVGGAYGVAGSEEGKEKFGGTLGVLLGAGLVGTTKVIGKALGKPGAKLGEEEAEKAGQAIIKDSPILTEDVASKAIKTVEEDPKIQAIGKAAVEPERLSSPTLFRGDGEMSAIHAGAEDINHAFELSREKVRNFVNESWDKDFKDFDQAANWINEVKLREGPEAIADRYKNYSVGQEMRNTLAEHLPNIYQPSAPERFVDKAADTQLVGRQIDNKIGGVNAEELVQRGSALMNKQQAVAHDLYKVAKPVYEKIAEANKGGFNLFEFVNNKPMAQLKAEIPALKPIEQEAVNGFMSLTKMTMEAANQEDKHLGVKSLGVKEYANGELGYFPNVGLGSKDTILAMDKKVAEASEFLGQDLTKVGPGHLHEVLANAEDPALKDVYDGLKYLNKTDSFTPQELKNALDRYQTVGNKSPVSNPEARALYERQNTTPVFLLEQDPIKALNKYQRNTLQTKYLRDHIDKLENLSSTLKGIGQDHYANYLKKYTTDLNGYRPDTWAASINNTITQWQTDMQRKINQSTSTFDRTKYSALKSAPDVLQMMQTNMYPFYLGLRLDAVARNLTQTLVFTGTELASKGNKAYNMGHVLRAWGETAAQALTNPKAIGRELEELKLKGLAPPEFNQKMVQWQNKGMEEGLRAYNSTLLLKGAKNTLDGLSRLSMSLYKLSDDLNRLITYKTSKGIIEAAAKGEPKAFELLNHLPTGQQVKIKQAIQAGNIDLAKDALSSHLISATQFHYDKAAMSEYGREMGKMFSSFTKWPSNIGGELVYGAKDWAGKDLVQKQLAKNKLLNKYLWPTAAFFGLQQTANVTGIKDDPYFQLVFGKGDGALTNLSSMAPVLGFGARGINVVPASVQPLAKAITGMSSPDWYNSDTGHLGKTSQDFIKAGAIMAPGGVGFRFLSQDLGRYDKAFDTDLQPEIFKSDK